MIAEFQNRIDSIMEGKLANGYKRAGRQLAPETWKEFRLGDLYTERNEPGHDGLPILTVSIHSGVSDGALSDDEIGKTVKRMEDKSAYKKAVAGDIVFNMMRAWQGAIGTVRTTGMVSPAYIVAKPGELVDPLFMNYYMRSPSMIYTMHSQSYGVTDFRLRLYWDSFAPIKCVLPSVPEQRRIASILSAQDHLIELKEKLLEEKKRQKKHLMQLLLTGKKRLLGFSGKWATKQLGDLFAERRETNLEHLELLSITSMQGVIPKSQLDLKDNSNEDKSKYLHICKGDIGYNTMRMWQGVSAFSNYDGIVSPAYTILKAKRGIDSQYFSYYFKLPSVIFLFYRFSQGLVADTLNLKYSNFKKIKVSYPPDINEQIAIAKILTEADHEITLLQKSIDTEKQKKKALMQLLLTGIVRVDGGRPEDATVRKKECGNSFKEGKIQ